jgi:hypothetical protein
MEIADFQIFGHGRFGGTVGTMTHSTFADEEFLPGIALRCCTSHKRCT